MCYPFRRHAFAATIRGVWYCQNASTPVPTRRKRNAPPYPRPKVQHSHHGSAFPFTRIYHIICFTRAFYAPRAVSWPKSSHQVSKLCIRKSFAGIYRVFIVQPDSKNNNMTQAPEGACEWKVVCTNQDAQKQKIQPSPPLTNGSKRFCGGI